MHALLPAVLCLALTGCGGGDDGGGASKDGPRYGEDDLYVAFGDSYTAAPGTGRADARDGCFRSVTDYPHQVAEATGMNLRDVSCGGATTESLTQVQRTIATTVPAQLDQLVKGTDVVTLRIGGNDHGMWPRLIGSCIGPAPDDHGAKCEDTTTDGVGLPKRMDGVQDSVTAIIKIVQQRAPKARVLVVGYPEIFPAGKKGCEALPIKGANLRVARRYNLGLNAALEGAADATGVRFVDVFASSVGHDICGKEPWIAGAPVERKGEVALHPHVEEAKNATRLVLAELD